MKKLKRFNLRSIINKLFNANTCTHKNVEWQWWDAGYRIRVCNDCGFEDFGYHNNRFYYKI